MLMFKTFDPLIGPKQNKKNLVLVTVIGPWWMRPLQHIAQRHHGVYLQGITSMIPDKVLNCFPHTALMATRALGADWNGESKRQGEGDRNSKRARWTQCVTGRHWEVGTGEDRRQGWGRNEQWQKRQSGYEMAERERVRERGKQRAYCQYWALIVPS